MTYPSHLLNTTVPPLSLVELGKRVNLEKGVFQLNKKLIAVPTMTKLSIQAAGEKGLGVGVPTMGGIGDAFKDFGIGAIAGLLFLLGSKIFGGLGIIAAPLLVGSMIKGERGKILATIAGFMLLAVGGIAASQSSSSSSNTGVM